MKVCKACKEEVPDNTSGACPKCKAMEGYTVSRTWDIRWNIEDERHEIKRTIDRKFQEYDEFIKQGKNVELYKKLKESLKKQVPNFLQQAEKHALERIERNKKAHQVSFSTDVIVGTHQQANEYIEKLSHDKARLESELENQKLLAKEIDQNLVERLKIIQENTKPKSKLRHFIEIVIAFFIGAIASYVGTFFYILGNNTS